jgi:hypothetical protein
VHPQQASGRSELFRHPSIRDAPSRPEGAVRQEHRTGDVSLGIVFGTSCVDDLDVRVVQMLGQPGNADEEVAVGVIEFSSGASTP